MTEERRFVIDSLVVEEDVRFSLNELCNACGAENMQLVALVDEGVLDPAGDRPEDWIFSGSSLSRARAALRLARDFDVGVAGIALVLDLLDEIDALKARLRRAGID